MLYGLRRYLPPQRRFGETTRPDAWWVQPLVVFLGFSAFIVYSTWAAFHPLYQGQLHLLVQRQRRGLSVAVLLAGNFRAFAARDFWHAAGLVAGWLPFSPAFLILWAPAGFRFTCYYYRGRVLQGVLGRPGQLRRRRTAQNHISANVISRSSSKTFTATSFIWRCCSFSFSRTTPGWRCGSPMRPARNISASASARWC